MTAHPVPPREELRPGAAALVPTRTSGASRTDDAATSRISVHRITVHRGRGPLTIGRR